MIFLLDFLSIIIPLIITVVLYKLYYKVFVIGYIKRTKRAIENSETEKAASMKALALKRQPKKMERLLKRL